MKRALLFACASLGVMAVVACAASNDEPQLSAADAGEPSLVADGDTVDTADQSAPVPDASARDASCSEAGWCITSLPDRDLVLGDIWPLGSRAFAVAESHTLGLKVLEWDDAVQTWKYIDDNSQNEYGFGQFAGKIWASSENEVYFGAAPRFIYRGVRATPSSPWMWQRDELDDNARDPVAGHDRGLGYYYDPETRESSIVPALGVWGTSADDVYAWYANTIFHRTRSGDGDTTIWTTEYVLDDADRPDETTYVFGASGSGHDDVWFASGRVRYDVTGTKPAESRDFSCPVVLHKTANGYRRLVDTTIESNAGWSAACVHGPGTVLFEDTTPIGKSNYTAPWEHTGWLTSIASAGDGAIVGILAGNGFAYVSSQDGGLARRNSIEKLTVPSNEYGALLLNSVWVDDTHAWASGWGLLVQIDNDPAAWSSGRGLRTQDDNAVDSGTYRISTSVLGGVPLDAPLYQVRGASNSNLWAIGARYALHKTTP